ncbi:MAG TPA: hypothetical protein VHJ34_08440 [Actinomycetota bacterium]|nr:hypothetical protein [Actinomycetota bacterium]
MYEFAIVVLLGIAAVKLVDTIAERTGLGSLHTALTIGTGIVVAWALDFSLFAQWDVAVRSDALAYVGTGLMIAAAGYAAPYALERVQELTTRRTTTQVPKAA